MPTSVTFSAPNEPHNNHLTDHGTLALNSFWVSQCPVAKYTHSPSLNRNKYLDKYFNLPFNFPCCVKFPWPSVDYQALKKITVKVHYPLPLVPAVLEQLCGASILTKLDL